MSVGEEDSQPQPLRRDASDLVGSGWSGVAMIVCVGSRREDALSGL